LEPNIYNLTGLDVEKIFERIDIFMGVDFQEFINKHPNLNEENVKIMKLLLSDLYSLEGLTPTQFKKREELIFDLTSIIGLHYSQLTIDVMDQFFQLPLMDSK